MDRCCNTNVHRAVVRGIHNDEKQKAIADEFIGVTLAKIADGSGSPELAAGLVDLLLAVRTPRS